MTTRMVRGAMVAPKWTAVVLSAGWVAVGCGPAVHSITIPSPGAITAAPTQATVVIVQPSTRFQSLNILDGQGQLVAQLNDRSHTMVQLPAGPVRLYAVLENSPGTADRIEGTLLPGKIYYATVSLRYGGVSFLALNPRSRDDRWSKKDEYLSATPRIQMDSQKVAQATTELGDTTRIMKKADAYVAKMDAAHLAERTIEEGDGL